MISMFSGLIILGAGFNNKTTTKATYHTNSIKTNEISGHQNFCMQTNLISVISREVFMSPFVLGCSVRQTMKQFPCV